MAGPQELKLRRSEDVAEVIGTPPNWLARYGTLLLMVIVVGLFAAAYFYTYPTYVTTDVTLTSINPPRDLRAVGDYDITQVLVNDGDTVRAGQTLIVSLSRARFEHILYLEDELIATRAGGDSALLSLTIPPSLSLGSLQGTVDSFLEAREGYRNLVARRLDGLTTRELRRRIAASERYIRELRNQQGKIQDRLILARQRLGRETDLADSGLDNGDEVAAARQFVENVEGDLNRNRNRIKAAALDISLMREQIESYRSGRSSTATQAAARMRDRFAALGDALAAWKQRYTVTSSVRGVVNLEPEIRVGHHVFRGNLLATIIPSETGDVIGRLQVEVNQSARVAVGQRVLVSFAGYDHLAYGSVEGVVSKRGRVPRNRRLPVEITFPHGLITTKGYPMERSPLMLGRASILVGEQRLLARFLGA